MSEDYKAALQSAREELEAARLRLPQLQQEQADLARREAQLRGLVRSLCALLGEPNV